MEKLTLAQLLSGSVIQLTIMVTHRWEEHDVVFLCKVKMLININAKIKGILSISEHYQNFYDSICSFYDIRPCGKLQADWV